MSSIYRRIQKVVDWVDAKKLIILLKAGGLQKIRRNEIRNDDHDCGKDLNEDQHAFEVPIIEVEAFQGEKVDDEGKVNQASNWNAKDLDEKNQYPQPQIEG